MSAALEPCSHLDGRGHRLRALDESPREAALRYTLPAIPYVRLRCTLRALGHANLPAYKGSLLRGAFGHALRRIACAFGPEQHCAGCRLRRACIYTRLFETFVEGEPPPFLRGLQTSPRPYIIEPQGEDRAVAPGETLVFDLILIGQAAAHHAHALLAVERMAAGGLGRERHRFELQSALILGADDLWRDADLQRPATPLLAGAPIPRSDAEAASIPSKAPAGNFPAETTLHFVTPTRIKIRDHLAPSVGVRPLVFAIVRRILELAHFHVPGADLDWTFRPLLVHSSTLRIQAANLWWHDWQRYSNRQQTKMSLGGFVGTLDLVGDLEPLWPLLRAAEVLHVGKGATFGLGRMQVGASS